MQCKELEAVLEQDGLSPLPADAREHLLACTSCQDLLADLSAIAVAAKRIPAEVTPPDRVWISIRAQLEAEGIIRDTEPVAIPAASPRWQNLALLFRPRLLATVAAALALLAGSVYLAQHRSPSLSNPSQPAPSVASVAPKSTTPSPVQTTNPLAPPKVSDTAPVHSARVSVPPQPRESTTVLRPSPSEETYLGDSAAVLTQTEDSLPRREQAYNAQVDAALRQNLRTLNEFIAECQTRLRENPQDELTREYLNSAYQQKAELLAAMMDNGRSEH